MDEDDFGASDNDMGDGAQGGTGTGTEGGEPGEGEVKKKSTRGSRACQVCRKLKMRCVGADDPPCKRCRTAGHEVSPSRRIQTRRLRRGLTVKLTHCMCYSASLKNHNEVVGRIARPT